MSGPAILSSPRDLWRKRRREYITASDVAAILGEDPHRGALAVWASKVAELDQDETVPMRRGRRFESVIADEYGDQTGRPVRDLGQFEIQKHPLLPWLGATLDRVTFGCDAMPAPIPVHQEVALVPLQLKLAVGSAREWDDDAAPPLRFVIQCQVEAACFGAPWSALAALIGPGPLATHDLIYDPAFFEAIIPHLERFRWHVETKTPPPADGKLGTTEAIRKLWPDAAGEACSLTEEDQSVMDELEAARARAAAAEHTEHGLANQLHARMAGAAFALLPDGSYIKRKRVDRKGYEVEASSYVTLQRWAPRYRRR